MRGRFTMRRSALTFAAFVLLAACGSPTTFDASAPTQEFAPVRQVQPTFDPFARDAVELQPSVPRVWFFEVDALPVADGGSISTLTASVDRAQSAAAAAGIPITPRYTFSTFVSGFSAEVDPAHVAAMAELTGVRRVMPVGLVQAPEVVDHGVTPDVTNSLTLTGARSVHDYGFTGSGIRVGIVDSGVMAEHPAFGGRVVAGFDFVGDRYSASSFEPGVDVPRPEDVYVNDPEWPNRPFGGDCQGHGTHVAGIVGGDDAAIRGVAPGALLGSYRVFGCSGSTHTDVILAAVERAFADGMDIVNLSLGSSNGWSQDFLAVALSRMLDLGVVPVASAGNNGANGVFTIGTPATGADVIAVASFDNGVLTQDVFRVAGRDIPYITMTGSAAPPGSGEVEVVDVGRACNGDPLLANPAGRVALIARGTCFFSDKALNVEAAGAIAAVVYNNAGETLSGSLDRAVTIPVVGIMLDDGNYIRIQFSPVRLAWLPPKEVPVNTEGRISTFSAYGLAPDLSLKPDLGAPGGFIYSAMIRGARPGVAGEAGYATLSGTSMAAPHVAGAVALLLQARPDVGPHRVRDLLSNTALPAPPAVLPDSPFYLESVHRQGAGLVRIDRAVVQGVQAVPGSLALGESAPGPFLGVMTLRNDTSVEVEYDLSSVERQAQAQSPLATAGSTSNPDFYFAAPMVEYFRYGRSSDLETIGSVVVPAHGMATFLVAVTPNPELVDGAIYGTYLVFDPVETAVTTTEAATAIEASAAAPALTAGRIMVPAAGFKGDYQQVDVFASCGSTSLVPFLLSSSGQLFRPPGTVYTMRGLDVPNLGFALAYPAERVTVEFVPQGARSWIGQRLGLTFDLARRDDFCSFTWLGFGDLDPSALPNGAYTMRVSVLRAGGDPSNPAHTQVAETPSFVIDRFRE